MHATQTLLQKLRSLTLAVTGFFALSFTLQNAAHAQTAPAPVLAAKSWVLLDVTSGQILTSQDPDQKVEPASLTKLMTAYLAFQALRDKKITLATRPPVSMAAYKAEGSRMFIDVKVPATVDELLHGMIIQSGNDAAVVLAEAIGGNEQVFAQMMTREAQRIGMRNTSFSNATGLPDANLYSTARDMSILAARIIGDFPENYTIYAQKSYTYNNITQENRNRLLFVDPTVDGMKTGHTDAAGYCLVASSKRDQPGFGARRLLSVVIGANSMATRATESQKLLAWGFQNFDLARFYPNGQAVGQYEVWKGKENIIGGVVEGGLLVAAPKGQTDQLKADVERMQPLIAPIALGQKIGTVRVRLGDKVIAEKPLVAQKAIEQAGWFGRTIDSVKLWMK